MQNMMDKATNFVSEKVTEKPEAFITDVALKDVRKDGIKYVAKLSITNPYSVSIPICEIRYTLKSVNREIASGDVPEPGNLKMKDTTPMEVVINVPHTVLVSLIKGIGAAWDIDYLLEIEFVVDLPIVKNFTIPITKKGEMNLPASLLDI